MEKLTRYLKDSWNIANALYATKKASKLNICLGNVSGDMDSVVGSIILGYYLTYKEGFYAEEEKDELDTESLTEERLSKFYIPVINMQNSELEARSDIIYHFKQTGINRDEIVSYELIDIQHYVKEDKLEVHLVDHNFPDCNQEDLVPFVWGIVDHHHEKKAEYSNLKYKDIRFCGAAATLAVNLVLSDKDLSSQLVDDKVAWVFSAPILIDTVNFAEKHRGKKWDQVDEDVFKQLKEIAGETIPSDYFKSLYFEKTDEEINVKLGWPLLARKDYKNYRMGNGLIFGISTVFLDIKSCEKNFGAAHLKEEFENIMKERSLDAYTVLTHYNDGEVKRQILSYAMDKDLAEKLVKFWEGIEEISIEKIDVGGLADIENCAVWQNHSTSYSRKKLEPHFRNYFDS